MTGYIIFWTTIIFFSLLSFTIMSFVMLINGISELKEMFKKLSKSDINKTNDNQ